MSFFKQFVYYMAGDQTYSDHLPYNIWHFILLGEEQPSCYLWFNICVLNFASRNETYCVTGSIKLHVYESSSVDMEKLSHPIPVEVGEKLTFKCPFLSDFNKTGRPIEWYKVRGEMLCILAADQHQYIICWDSNLLKLIVSSFFSNVIVIFLNSVQQCILLFEGIDTHSNKLLNIMK